MGMNDGIAGGLLGGIVQGMQQGAQMKQQKEQNKIQMQMAKQQMEQAKIAAEEDKFWREKLFPGGVPGQETGRATQEKSAKDTPVLGDGYNDQVPPPQQEQQSVLEMMTPLQLAYIEKKTGIPTLKAGTNAETRRYHDQMADFREREQSYVTVTNPDGSQQTVPRPKYSPSQSGQGMPQMGGFQEGRGGFQTAPTKGNTEIAEANLPLWINANTLESVPFGMTPNEAQKKGFTRVNTGKLTRIDDFKAVGSLLNTMEDLMANVFPAEGKEGGAKRISGAAQRVTLAKAQMGEKGRDAALLQNVIEGTTSALIRMFEKGTLTDQDIKRAKKLTIGLTDSGDLAWKQLRELKKFVKSIQSSFITGNQDRPSLKLGKKEVDVDSIKNKYKVEY